MPYMTKRIVRSKNLECFKQLILRRYNGSQAIGDEDVHKQIDELSPGCFVFVYEHTESLHEAITMHKFEYALSTMVGRENVTSL